MTSRDPVQSSQPIIERVEISVVDAAGNPLGVVVGGVNFIRADQFDPIRGQLSESRKLCTAFEEAVGEDAGTILTLKARVAELEANEKDTRKSALKEAMEIVGSMRQSEACLFDEKHSGQRGCDRLEALHDAYIAIGAALSHAGPVARDGER
jgi:hypothetical protein